MGLRETLPEFDGSFDKVAPLLAFFSYFRVMSIVKWLARHSSPSSKADFTRMNEVYVLAKKMH